MYIKTRFFRSLWIDIGIYRVKFIEKRIRWTLFIENCWSSKQNNADILTPFVRRFCRNAEWPPGRVGPPDPPTNGYLDFSFSSSCFSISTGFCTGYLRIKNQKQIWIFERSFKCIKVLFYLWHCEVFLLCAHFSERDVRKNRIIKLFPLISSKKYQLKWIETNWNQVRKYWRRYLISLYKW